MFRLNNAWKKSIYLIQLTFIRNWFIELKKVNVEFNAIECVTHITIKQLEDLRALELILKRCCDGVRRWELYDVVVHFGTEHHSSNFQCYIEEQNCRMLRWCAWWFMINEKLN